MAANREKTAVACTDLRNRSIAFCGERYRAEVLCISVIVTMVAAQSSLAGSTLQVEPSRVVLDGKTARQQLAVTLRDAGGLVRDVTAQCRFRNRTGRSCDGHARWGRRASGRWDGHFASDIPERDSRGRSPRRAVGLAAWTPSFRTDIAPLLSKAGCNMGACHGNLNGKGGFKLSLRGEDPSFDHQSLTHDQSGRRLSRIAPESSLIVIKPTGAIPHEGGLRFARDSIEAQAPSRLDRFGCR